MKKLALFLVLSTALSTHARTGYKIYLDNNFNKVSEQDVINGLIANPGAVYYKLVEVTIKQKTNQRGITCTSKRDTRPHHVRLYSTAQ